MAHDEDLWFVQLPTGAVRAMTLDDLDAAFQSGTIDEDTRVRRDGQSTWTKLSDELGASEPAPVSSQTPSVAPVVMDFDEDDFAPLRSSKKRIVAGLGLAAVAAIALAAFGVTKLDGAHTQVNASVANAAPPQLPPSDPQSAAQKITLTEEQKKALADKDAELHQKLDQRRRDHANKSAPATHTTQPPPFQNSGDTYDPLNSKL